MRVVFRTDASLQIGSGHVMRCLTLAQALRERGAQCEFICRQHSGNMITLITARGFAVRRLQPCESALLHSANLAHASWLGCSWEVDAAECASILEGSKPDWLIVDHYALDSRWEKSLRPYCSKLMVIDDLADRTHECDFLLDQNLGRQPQDYLTLVPPGCQILTGPSFSLLRPEFAQWRSYSLARRSHGELKHILVTMGGVDTPNATAQVLGTLRATPLPRDCKIAVIMGPNAPWLENVSSLARLMPRHTQVWVNVSNMAEHMATADLAIGAAGSTSWERCCLGLPSITMVLADNQIMLAGQLQQAGATYAIPDLEHIAYQLPEALECLCREPHRMLSMSHNAAALTDGNGTSKVIERLMT